MTAWPNLRAVLLGAMTPVGLAGMFVMAGLWDALFLIVAAMPVAIGVMAAIQGVNQNADR